jgi:hypothetical protein
VLGPIATALPAVTKIEPIEYHWKPRGNSEAGADLVYGFSAQQLLTVDPTLVDSSDEDHLRIHDRMITPLLVKAVQELSAKVDALQTELNELKSRG